MEKGTIFIPHTMDDHPKNDGQYQVIVQRENHLYPEWFDLDYKNGVWLFCEKIPLFELGKFNVPLMWFELRENHIVCTLDEIEMAFDAGWKVQEEYGGMSVSHPMFRKWLKQNYPSLAKGI